MSSWQQRVLAATAAIHVGGAGRPAGTGVLIEPDKVLTCRHVVAAGRAEGSIKAGITVRLPGLAPVEVWPEQGGWLGVDAVVLTLPEPVEVAPVPLSGSLRVPAKVELVGYPQADLTEEGIWRTFTVHAETKSLVQLDWTDAGSFIGHSGGPVVDADSGKLVGLLREGSPEGRFDRYLPLLRLVERGVLERLPWLIDGDDAEGHFARRSQGRRGGGGRDVFTGRQAALERITAWLTGSGPHTGRVLVVTGQPGAGKSAVTARAGLQVASDLGRDPKRRGLLFHARSMDAAAFRRAAADLFGSGADESSMRCSMILTASAPLPLTGGGCWSSTPSMRRPGLPIGNRSQCWWSSLPGVRGCVPWSPPGPCRPRVPRGRPACCVGLGSTTRATSIYSILTTTPISMKPMLRT